VNNLVVIAQKTDKNSITGYGGPDKFLNEFSYLLGKQVFAGDRPCLPRAQQGYLLPKKLEVSWACVTWSECAHVCNCAHVRR